MDAAEYKKLHEYFMQGNVGSTAIHTFLCIFFTVLSTLLVATQPLENQFLRYLLEYMIVIVTLINAHTILANHIYVLDIILFVLLTTKFCFNYRKLPVRRVFNLPNVFKTNKIQSISIIRGLTYLITVYSIFAVDFNIFPRALAKTEKKGFSFMDTGVGLFALISGVVHKDPKNNSYITILKSNMKIVTILTVLGLARYFSIKQLDYHEHVTEYGVHWNFFFTLAICKSLTTLLLIFCNKPLVLSIVLVLVHESALDLGLRDWVFSDISRSDFLSANREGITSCLGYVSLYIFAVYVKNILNNHNTRRKHVLRELVLGAALLWISTYNLQTSFRPVSRVLANITYVTFVSSIFMTVLSVLYTFEVLFQNEKLNLVFEVPPIIKAINENGLIFFIIGNLLTGTFNLSVYTLFIPVLFALPILNLYMIINIGIILILNKYGIKM